MTYRVFVDDNGAYMDEDARYSPGSYESLDEAVDACRAIVERSLCDLHRPGMRSEELLAAYKSWGDDPWVCVPSLEANNLPFSAWTYAEERCRALCAA